MCFIKIIFKNNTLKWLGVIKDYVISFRGIFKLEPMSSEIRYINTA